LIDLIFETIINRFDMVELIIGYWIHNPEVGSSSLLLGTRSPISGLFYVYALHFYTPKIITPSILVRPQILFSGFTLTTFMDMIGQKDTDYG